jgi:phospholipid/cholesterol/gamma-HCH transport system substrate-binding protein
MSDRVKNIIIGLFVTSAITVLIAMILFFKPSVGDGKQLIHVRFANIAGISLGTRVTFAGKPVGEVTQIIELPNTRDHADENGRIYLYELTLKIDSNVNVYSSDEIAMRTTGLMGEKSVAILPKVAPNAIKITNQILNANSVDPLENTILQIAKVSNRIETTVGHIDEWFLLNQKDLSDVVTSVAGTFNHTEKIANNIASGKGTIGRLVEGDDMYLRVTSIMNKCETLMNDMNNYGILYQYNKSWQKNRTRKINEVWALRSPEGFRTYYEKEMDGMTTSLARLTEMLDRAGENREAIVESPAFKKDLAALMRQVQALSDSLKLYNDSLFPQSE